MNSHKDVCLVYMPMGDIERPSLGLGLLQSILSAGGISCQIDYANLRFLELAGVDMLRLLGSTRAEDQLAEWLFASTAFPDFKTDDDHFLHRLYARNRLLIKEDEQTVAAKLLAFRLQIPGFVEGVAHNLLEYNPCIVGCSTTFQQNVASLALLRCLRKLNPDIITLMGGANCEGIMGLTLHQAFPWVDFVVSGEADQLIVPLCQQLLEQGRDFSTLDLSTAIFSPKLRENDYLDLKQTTDIPVAKIRELDTLPTPDYRDYFQTLKSNRYRNYIIPGLPFESSRGCWWGAVSHCTFCGLNGGGIGFRVKSSQRVVEELSELTERYNIKNLEAVDNILDMAYFKTLLPALETKGYTLFFETKSNFNRQHIEQLYRAGVRWVQPGIESLDTRILKLMGKGCAAWQNIQLLKFCRQWGIRVAWSIIAGFPGEDDNWYEEMAELIPKLTHFNPGDFTRLRYDRFSLYHNNPKHYGLELEPSELYRYVYPLTEEQLANMVYFFEPMGEPQQQRRLLGVGSELLPGQSRVHKEVEAWGKEWSSEPVVLSARRVDGDTVEITDSRSCAFLPRYLITGLGTRLLDLCDSALTALQLENCLPENLSLATESVAVAINDLCEKKLMVIVDGRYLSLTSQEPFQPLYPPVFPGGYLLHKPLPN